MEIAGRSIGGDAKPYVIAEAGINIRTDVELGKSFIDAAAQAGADAIKFQTHITDAEMVESEMEAVGAREVYNTVAETSLSKEQQRELQTHCRENDITFLSTPFSVEAVDLLDDLNVPAIKIGSGELTNYNLLDRAAATGRPLIVSTGISNLATIREAHKFLTERIDSFALLYCVSAYPTEPTDFKLDTIGRFEDEFDRPIGFSDHSTGTEAATIAMAKGAAIVEKHFTLDRRLPGPDQAVSIEPEALEDLVNNAELMAKTRGETPSVQEEEAAVSEWARHSVVTKRDVTAGTVLTEDDLTTKRPGTGIPASEFFDVVGRSVVRDIDANSVLRDADIE